MCIYMYIYLNTMTRSLSDKCYTILKVVLITMSMRVVRSCVIVTVVTMITQNSAGHCDSTYIENTQLSLCDSFYSYSVYPNLFLVCKKCISSIAHDLDRQWKAYKDEKRKMYHWKIIL